MINLRYHIVSITAVFLALGIGVTLGSSFIQRYTIDTLETRLDELGDRLDRTDGENRILRDRIDERDELDERFAAEGRALFEGHLDDVPVLVVSFQGTDVDIVTETRSSLRAAGARVSGTLVFTSRWDELSDQELEELGDLLGRRLVNDTAARSLALRRVGAELAEAAQPPPEPPDPPSTPGDQVEPDGDQDGQVPGGPDDTADVPGADVAAPLQDPDDTPTPPADPEADPDQDPTDPAPTDPEPEPDDPDSAIIEALVEAGFLEFVPDASSGPLPEYGMRYVVVSAHDTILAPDAVAVPMLESLVVGSSRALPFVVAAPIREEVVEEDPAEVIELLPDPLVAAVRGHDRLGSLVSTVDDLDRFTGQAAVVLAVSRIDRREVGHYGVSDDAGALVPVGQG